MALFRVLKTTHKTGVGDQERSYAVGETLKSDKDLDKLFPNKFQRLAEKKKSQPEPEEEEEEEENEDEVDTEDGEDEVEDHDNNDELDGDTENTEKEEVIRGDHVAKKKSVKKKKGKKKKGT